MRPAGRTCSGSARKDDRPARLYLALRSPRGTEVGSVFSASPAAPRASALSAEKKRSKPGTTGCVAAGAASTGTPGPSRASRRTRTGLDISESLLAGAEALGERGQDRPHAADQGGEGEPAGAARPV